MSRTAGSRPAMLIGDIDGNTGFGANSSLLCLCDNYQSPCQAAFPGAGSFM
jgi:hypothetical protein